MRNIQATHCWVIYLGSSLVVRHVLRSRGGPPDLGNEGYRTATVNTYNTRLYGSAAGPVYKTCRALNTDNVAVMAAYTRSSEGMYTPDTTTIELVFKP